MDCEKFDRIVLDLLYDELDEITGAAGRRHMEHCVRCKDIGARLRVTRDLGRMDLVDPPVELFARIVAAEEKARRELPARQRIGRAISVLAGYAMRPQLAMAALLLLVIGSSLLLLRIRPGEQKNVLVTERGVPEAEPELALAPLAANARTVPAAPAASVRPAAEPTENRDARAVASSKAEAARVESAESQRAVEADRAYEQALSAYRDRKYEEAEQRFAQVAARGGDNAASAALYSAQSARARAGCPTAVTQFVDVYRRFPEAPAGREAAWQAAGCYRTLGDFERARNQYELLLNAPGYADRAQAALSSLGDSEGSPELSAVRSLGASKSKAAPPPAQASAKSADETPSPATRR